MRFIWGNSTSRFSKHVLFQTQVCGLGIPHFLRYFQVAQLFQLTKYHAIYETLLWVNLKEEYCGYTHKIGLPFLTLFLAILCMFGTFSSIPGYFSTPTIAINLKQPSFCTRPPVTMTLQTLDHPKTDLLLCASVHQQHKILFRSSNILLPSHLKNAVPLFAN